MSKERLRQRDLYEYHELLRQQAIEIQAQQMRNDVLRRIIVSTLKSIGVPSDDHKSPLTFVISKKVMEAVETSEGLQTYNKDSDDVYVIYRKAETQITFKPKCTCGGKAPEDVPEDDEGKHEDGCIFWRSFRPQSVVGEATGDAITAATCPVHKLVGNVGGKCPECDRERVERIECATLIVRSCDLCGREGLQLYRFISKPKIADAEPKGRFCEECGRTNNWTEGFVPIPLYCGHYKKSHLFGKERCKLGDCPCEAFTCAHNEREADNEKRVLRCADPDCDWSVSFDELQKQMEGEKRDG